MAVIDPKTIEDLQKKVTLLEKKVNDLYDYLKVTYEED